MIVGQIPLSVSANISAAPPDAGPLGPVSCRQIQESWRAPQQHAATFAREDRAAIGHFGQFKCNETFDDESIEGAASRRRHADSLQRFPLIVREIVVEFRAHAASNAAGVFRGCLTQPA